MMNKGMRGQGIEENERMGMNWVEENGLGNTITYQGREYDRDAGLYYYRARYQDPRLGRFLEVDPLLREVPEYTAGNSLPTSGNSGCGCCGSSGSSSLPIISPEQQIYAPTLQQMLPSLPINTTITNLYILENNNPVNLTDPTGMCYPGAIRNMKRIGYHQGSWGFYIAGYVEKDEFYYDIHCIYTRLMAYTYSYEECVQKQICSNGIKKTIKEWEPFLRKRQLWEKKDIALGNSVIAFSLKEVTSICEEQHLTE